METGLMITPTAEIPGPSALRVFREMLFLSQTELSAALHFGPNGDKTVRDWESGNRNGEPFAPTPTAWAAFRYLIGLADTYRSLPSGDQRKKIAALLPESLR